MQPSCRAFSWEPQLLRGDSGQGRALLLCASNSVPGFTRAPEAKRNNPKANREASESTNRSAAGFRQDPCRGPAPRLYLPVIRDQA